MAVAGIRKIDTRNLCVFCLRKADSIISSDSELINQILCYIQPKWTVCAKEFRFVVRNTTYKTPPVCTSCKLEVLKLETYHKEIVELSKRLREVRMKLVYQVQSVREYLRCPKKRKRKEKMIVTRTEDCITSDEVSSKGTYPERFEVLVGCLRGSLQISNKVVKNTVDFLTELQDSSTAKLPFMPSASSSPSESSVPVYGMISNPTPFEEGDLSGPIITSVTTANAAASPLGTSASVPVPADSEVISNQEPYQNVQLGARKTTGMQSASDSRNSVSGPSVSEEIIINPKPFQSVVSGARKRKTTGMPQASAAAPPSSSSEPVRSVSEMLFKRKPIQSGQPGSRTTDIPPVSASPSISSDPEVIQIESNFRSVSEMLFKRKPIQSVQPSGATTSMPSASASPSSSTEPVRSVSEMLFKRKPSQSVQLSGRATGMPSASSSTSGSSVSVPPVSEKMFNPAPFQKGPPAWTNTHVLLAAEKEPESSRIPSILRKKASQPSSVNKSPLQTEEASRIPSRPSSSVESEPEADTKSEDEEDIKPENEGEDVVWVQSESEEEEIELQDEDEHLIDRNQEDPLKIQVSKPKPTKLNFHLPKPNSPHVKCEACSLAIPLMEMPDHMYDHVGQFACKCPRPACWYTFVSRWSKGLEHHLWASRNAGGECWKHISGRPEFLDKSGKRVLQFYCATCGEQFQVFGDLNAHLQDHEKMEKDKKFACPVPTCEERFALKQSGEIHLVNHVFPMVLEKRARETKNAFPKQDENWSFRMEKYCRIEQRCEVCGLCCFAFEMPKHMAKHVGEYAYECPNPKCKFTFVSRWSIAYASHLTGHTSRNKTKHRNCWTVSGLESPSLKDTLRRTCDTCGSIVRNFEEFESHLEEHETEEKNFTCPVENCGKMYTNRQSVEWHLRAHTRHEAARKARMEKSKSEKSGPSNSDEHPMEKTPTEKCTLCKKVLKVEAMCQHLLRVHKLEEGELVRCQLCPLAVVNRELYVNHVARHLAIGSGNSVFCDLCQEQGGPDSLIPYISALLFRQHCYDKHGIGVKILCEKDNCVFTSFSNTSMRTHVRRVHEGPSAAYIKCAECFPPQIFWKWIDLKFHKVEVHGAEKIKCPFCSETFSSETRYHHHKSKHTKRKKSFVCHLCGVTLGTGTNYRIHMMSIHAKLNNWICDKCGKSCNSKYSLHKHLRVAHKEGPPPEEYICEICGRKMRKTKDRVEEHMRTHTDERPHICSLCGFRFRQKSCWRAHMQLHKEKGDKFKPKKPWKQVKSSSSPPRRNEAETVIQDLN